MSGDRIYMDYTSSLGPIDPQIHNGKEFVPALGYLDKVEKMIQKSAEGKLTDAELWHSHGRKIGVFTLTKLLRLKIEDFSSDTVFRPKVRSYSEFITDYINRNAYPFFLNSRCYF